jgi:hypothetical protein
MFLLPALALLPLPLNTHPRTVLEPIKASLATLAKSAGGEMGKTAKMAVHVVNSLLHQ